jgi:uncharacterized protein YbaR (Trm112 family)
MAISPELLKVIACPVSRQPLRLAAGKELEELLRRVRWGTVKPRGSVDWKVEEVTGLLVTKDGKMAYPVIDDIPNLLPTSCISLSE